MIRSGNFVDNQIEDAADLPCYYCGARYPICVATRAEGNAGWQVRAGSRTA
jgi:hypothetical protein